MAFTPVMLAMLFTAGAATGILGAMLGTGGGVFLIPILLLGFHVPMHYAVATSIITVVATSCAVASANVERGTANMRLGMMLEIATSIGAIVGGLSVAKMDPRLLEGLFAVVLVPTAVLMWRGRTERAAAGDEKSIGSAPPVRPQSASERSNDVAELGQLGQRYFDSQSGREVSYRIRRLPGGMAISFVAGLLSGMLGIGGGVFKVPALHLMCGMPIKAAAATSNFMIGVTATASAFLYFGRGQVWTEVTAAVVLGVLAGSVVGSVVSQRVGGKVTNRLFAVLLIGVAVQMFFRVFG